MKNVVDILLAQVSAEQLMQVLVKVSQTVPVDVIQAFDDVLDKGADADLCKIVDRLGTEATIPHQDYQHIRALAGGGKKVAAIKHLRDITGWSLRGTKDWVEDTFSV